MAGYSQTPLAKKLGYKPGFLVQIINEPAYYRDILTPLPEAVSFVSTDALELDLIHFFSDSAQELQQGLPAALARIKQQGMIWVSWPKKTSKVPTDISEDRIRELALPLGLVDVKVCAVDDIWSGLKLMIRKENRK